MNIKAYKSKIVHAPAPSLSEGETLCGKKIAYWLHEYTTEPLTCKTCYHLIQLVESRRPMRGRDE